MGFLPADPSQAESKAARKLGDAALEHQWQLLGSCFRAAQELEDELHVLVSLECLLAHSAAAATHNDGAKAATPTHGCLPRLLNAHNVCAWAADARTGNT